MSIRITEYMYDGANGEFIEFTNVGTTAIDMTGWSYYDSGRIVGGVSLSNFGILQPGESAILTEANVATFRTAWSLSSSVKVIGGLTVNLGRSDEINVYDAAGSLVDRLTYGDNSPIFPGSIRTQGRSGWVSAAGLGANNIYEWTLSSLGDLQNSYASTGGNVGNPGFFFLPTSGTGEAPTIAVVPTTAFLSIPSTGVGLISGVINDPTDPAQRFGLDFTFSDADTPLADLMITVGSSNQSVVANSGLSLTGTGDTRNLKITPAGVGITDITITVSDGVNSTSYTLAYGASAASLVPNTTRFHTGASDASTAIALDNAYMLVANDEDQTIRLYDRTASGLPLKTFDFTASLGLTDRSGGVPREIDIEASTRIGDRIYWLASHSNSSGGAIRPNRYRLFATDVSGSGLSTELSFVGFYANLRNELIAWGDANGYNFSASAASGKIPEDPAGGGFNIEGLTIAPDGTTGYIAFRAPNVPTGDRMKALIAPVLNFTQLVTGASSAAIGAPIELDLGGRGIRSIERNTNGEYVIVAGPADSATGVAPKDFRLYTWTGNVNDAPLERTANLTVLDTQGSFESIVELPDTLTATSQIQLLVDNGDTVWYNNGTASKDLQTNLQKFRSEIVILGGGVFKGTDRRDLIVGTEGNDVVLGSAGPDVITTSTGNDQVVYSDLNQAGDVIQDFAVGSDKIVLSQLLRSIGYTGLNAIADGYVRFRETGSRTQLLIDTDSVGPTSGRPLATFDGISVAQLNNPANFVF